MNQGMNSEDEAFSTEVEKRAARDERSEAFFTSVKKQTARDERGMRNEIS
jgi:hypothetical protein